MTVARITRGGSWALSDSNEATEGQNRWGGYRRKDASSVDQLLYC